MALDQFVAGRYSGAYNLLDVGITRDGYLLTLDSEMEDIGETDAWGLTVIDGLWRGGNCFIQFTSVAYKAGSLAAFWPYGGAVNANGVLGVLVDGTIAAPNQLPIARLASDIAKPLVLTSTAGTPAAANPATLTATAALLSKNNNGRVMFNSKLRDVPVRLRCYPFTSGNITRFFTTT